MHRIIRTGLATLGAAAVVSGGGAALSYATAPTAAATSPSASTSSDQVAALDKSADDLLAKISTLEQQLASSPTLASTDGPLTRQDTSSPVSTTPATTTRTTTVTRVTTTTATSGAVPVPTTAPSDQEHTDD